MAFNGVALDLTADNWRLHRESRDLLSECSERADHRIHDEPPDTIWVDYGKAEPEPRSCTDGLGHGAGMLETIADGCHRHELVDSSGREHNHSHGRPLQLRRGP